LRCNRELARIIHVEIGQIEPGGVVRTFAIIVLVTLWVAAPVAAQTGLAADSARPESANASTGRSPPEDKGQPQPQGWTGPINTQSGGAPAESPQGQSPPGMQAAPSGSTTTVVAPDK